MLKLLNLLSGLGLLVALVFLALNTLSNMPAVHISVSTGKCVRVEAKDKSLTCTDLSNIYSYEVIYVQ